MELNVWNSCEATSAVRNETTNKWDVSVKRADGSQRVMHVNYVVMTVGFPYKDTKFVGQVRVYSVASRDFP